MDLFHGLLLLLSILWHLLPIDPVWANVCAYYLISVPCYGLSLYEIQIITCGWKNRITWCFKRTYSLVKVAAWSLA